MPSRKSALPIPVLLIAVGAILIIGSVLWLIFSSGLTDQATPAVSEDIPYPDVPRISVQDAKAAFDINNAIFVDTRGETAFSGGHIPGAIWVTTEDVLDRLDEIDPSKWIITYCT